MKKFLLIVNATVFIVLLSHIYIPSSVTAQNPSISISPSAQPNSDPLSLLRELLRILFSFNTTSIDGGQLPSIIPYPSISAYPSFPISPFVTYPPPPPGTGYVYYPQCRGPYDNYPLPSGCNLCKAGCGPTTVSMILASLADRNINPPIVVDYYKNHNYYLGCSGSRYSDAKNTLSSFGLKTTDYLTYSTQTIDQVAADFRGYLNSGWTLFALANYCDGGCGHFFWIIDIDAYSNVWAYDPYYGRREAPPINENRYYPFPRYRVAFGVKK